MAESLKKRYQLCNTESSQRWTIKPQSVTFGLQSEAFFVKCHVYRQLWSDSPHFTTSGVRAMQSITAFDSRVVALVSHLAGTRALRLLRYLDDGNEDRIGSQIPCSVNSVDDIIFESELCNEHQGVLDLDAAAVLELIESDGVEEFDRCVRMGIFAAVADRLIHDPHAPTDMMISPQVPEERSESSVMMGAQATIACRFQDRSDQQHDRQIANFDTLKKNINKVVDTIRSVEAVSVMNCLLRLPTSSSSLPVELDKFSSHHLRVLVNRHNIAGIPKLLALLKENVCDNVDIAMHAVEQSKLRSKNDRLFNRWFIASDTGGIQARSRVVFVSRRSESNGDNKFLIGATNKIGLNSGQYTELIAIPPML